MGYIELYELKCVAEAIETEWISTGGMFINQFGNKTSEYVKVLGTVAFQSGIVGFHIALILCRVKRMDEVVVSMLTFIATVNPVSYIGAEPILWIVMTH